MAGTAPAYCNVKLAQEKATPAKATTFQRLSAGATTQQIINTVNYNFNLLSKGNYVENRGDRTTEIVRIYNPDDSSQYVDVKQITGLNFVNPYTGQTLTFRR